MGDAGVVYQDISFPEFLLDGLKCLFYKSFVADIPDERQAGDMERVVKIMGKAAKFLARGTAVESKAVPGFGKFFGNCPSNAPGGAGNKSGF